MIVYSESKDVFLADVDANNIHTKIHEEFRRRLHHGVSTSEVDSWRNSLQFMSNTLRDDAVPGDAGVAIEFNIPLTSKRVDFILTGKNDDRQDVAVIVELKQWSSVKATDMDGVVTTWLGGREVNIAHPSYQAWSYAALIEDYNETVRNENIGLLPCAYLHNLDSGEVIHDERYATHLSNAPSFIARDAAKLRAFLSRYVRHGDSDGVMYRIEHGRIRPSKALSDCLASMLQGNREFLMIDEQKLVFETAVDLAHRAQSGAKQVLIVEGGPGTGKSVVAVNLLVELTRCEMVAQYVSRNAAPRAVYAARLAGTMRKTRIHNLFKGAGAYTEAEPGCFDALIVDEAHRLNEKSGLYQNLGENQVKELIAASKLSVFFLDEDQRVTLKDIGSIEEISRWAVQQGARVARMALTSQFRCNGSDSYLAFLDDALQIRETAHSTITPDEFDFRVFDDPAALHDAIRQRNASDNKARMVAGYCWDWASKKDPQAMDIVFPESGYSAQWNLTRDGSLWIIAPESVEEVGCIHTCQGLELDYVGVIVGPDFVVRDSEVVTDAGQRSRMDSSVKGYKTLLRDAPEQARYRADQIIKNTYRTLMTRGQKGCYVYCTDPETAEYFRSRIADTQEEAPRADIHQLAQPYEGLNAKLVPFEDVRPYENALPIYDLKIAAGGFSDEQIPPDSDWVEMPAHIRPSRDLFVTRVVGESMNRRIPNGAWCLFRFNPGGTRNGKIVLVSHRSINDSETGEQYTIKRYFSEKSTNTDDECLNARVVLRPESLDPQFEPIVLTVEEDGERVVVAEFLQVLD